MTVHNLLFLCLLMGMLIVGILFLLFGQITVRKLRKNPNTKNTLGLEYFSGWDIINVAQALAIPSSISKKLEESHLSSLYANAKLLRAHTSLVDRLLAVIFYWMMMVTVLFGISLMLLNAMGVFTG